MTGNNFTSQIEKIHDGQEKILAKLHQITALIKQLDHKVTEDLAKNNAEKGRMQNNHVEDCPSGPNNQGS